MNVKETINEAASEIYSTRDIPERVDIEAPEVENEVNEVNKIEEADAKGNKVDIDKIVKVKTKTKSLKVRRSEI